MPDESSSRCVSEKLDCVLEKINNIQAIFGVLISQHADLLIDFTTKITMMVFLRCRVDEREREREMETIHISNVKYVASSHCVGVSHRRETCFLNSVSSNFTKTKIKKEKKQAQRKKVRKKKTVNSIAKIIFIKISF